MIIGMIHPKHAIFYDNKKEYKHEKRSHSVKRVITAAFASLAHIVKRPSPQIYVNHYDKKREIVGKVLLKQCMHAFLFLQGRVKGSDFRSPLFNKEPPSAIGEYDSQGYE